MDYQSYWNANIDKWSELYLDISHGNEALDAPPWFSKIYQRSIGKVEARLMRTRYELTISFLNSFVKPGVVFSDIGCGTGIFCVEALKRGAIVQAIDISEKALEVTRINVAKHYPSGQITFHLMDLQEKGLPKSDLALAMGVTPYVVNLDAFLGNILSNSKMLYCQYTDPKQIFNRIRRLAPALNVRNLVFHGRDEVSQIYAKNDVDLKRRTPFATGFIDLVGIPNAQ